MYRVALVEYINALPFLDALENTALSEDIVLIKSTPQLCAQFLQSGMVDLALLPVGAFNDFDHLQIISDYCIGCDGAVRTVSVFSNKEINNICSISKDRASRSSNLLLEVLLQKFNFLQKKVRLVEHDQEADGKLIIGDLAFKAESQYQFKLDLGLAWKELTGLPFVFAVWVSSKKLDSQFISKLNQAFSESLNNERLDKLIQSLESKLPDFKNYFHNNISYHFNESKRRALDLFCNYAEIKRWS